MLEDTPPPSPSPPNNNTTAPTQQNTTLTNFTEPPTHNITPSSPSASIATSTPPPPTTATNSTSTSTSTTSNTTTNANSLTAHLQDHPLCPTCDHVTCLQFRQDIPDSLSPLIPCSASRPRLEKSDPCGCSSGFCSDDTCILYACQEECPYPCPNHPRCRNNRFRLKKWKSVQVFDAGLKGRGLRTLESISPGEFIIEYVGVVVKKRHLEDLFRIYQDDKMLYIMCAGTDRYIDARRRGGLARYINHSCDPNCTVHRWTVDGVTRAGIFALRGIAVGEELSFDYQWERKRGRRYTKCECGTPQCRGWLEKECKKSEEEEEWEAKLTGHWKKGVFSGEGLVNRCIKIFFAGNGEYFVADVMRYNEETGRHLVLFKTDREESWEDLRKEVWLVLDDEGEAFVIKRKELVKREEIKTVAQEKKAPILFVPESIKKQLVERGFLNKCNSHYRVQIDVMKRPPEDDPLDPEYPEDHWTLTITGLKPHDAYRFLSMHVERLKQHYLLSSQKQLKPTTSSNNDTPPPVPTLETPPSQLHTANLIAPLILKPHLYHTLPNLKYKLPSSVALTIDTDATQKQKQRYASLHISSPNRHDLMRAKFHLYREITHFCHDRNLPQITKSSSKDDHANNDNRHYPPKDVGWYVGSLHPKEMVRLTTRIDLLTDFRTVHDCMVYWWHDRIYLNTCGFSGGGGNDAEMNRLETCWTMIRDLAKDLDRGVTFVRLAEGDEMVIGKDEGIWDFLTGVTKCHVCLDPVTMSHVRIDPACEDAERLLKFQLWLKRRGGLRRQGWHFGRDWGLIPLPETSEEGINASNSPNNPHLNPITSIITIAKSLSSDRIIILHATTLYYRYLLLSPPTTTNPLIKPKDLIVLCLYLAQKSQKIQKWKLLSKILSKSHGHFYKSKSTTLTTQEEQNWTKRILTAEGVFLNLLNYDLCLPPVEYYVYQSIPIIVGGEHQNKEYSSQMTDRLLNMSLSIELLSLGPEVWVLSGVLYVYTIVAGLYLGMGFMTQLISLWGLSLEKVGRCCEVMMRRGNKDFFGGRKGIDSLWREVNRMMNQNGVTTGGGVMIPKKQRNGGRWVITGVDDRIVRKIIELDWRGLVRVMVEKSLSEGDGKYDLFFEGGWRGMAIWEDMMRRHLEKDDRRVMTMMTSERESDYQQSMSGGDNNDDASRLKYQKQSSNYNDADENRHPENDKDDYKDSRSNYQSTIAPTTTNNNTWNSHSSSTSYDENNKTTTSSPTNATNDKENKNKKTNEKHNPWDRYHSSSSPPFKTVGEYNNDENSRSSNNINTGSSSSGGWNGNNKSDGTTSITNNGWTTRTTTPSSRTASPTRGGWVNNLESYDENCRHHETKIDISKATRTSPLAANGMSNRGEWGGSGGYHRERRVDEIPTTTMTSTSSSWSKGHNMSSTTNSWSSETEKGWGASQMTTHQRESLSSTNAHSTWSSKTTSCNNQEWTSRSSTLNDYNNRHESPSSRQQRQLQEWNTNNSESSSSQWNNDTSYEKPQRMTDNRKQDWNPNTSSTQSDWNDNPHQQRHGQHQQQEWNSKSAVSTKESSSSEWNRHDRLQSSPSSNNNNHWSSKSSPPTPKTIKNYNEWSEYESNNNEKRNYNCDAIREANDRGWKSRESSTTASTTTTAAAPQRGWDNSTSLSSLKNSSHIHTNGERQDWNTTNTYERTNQNNDYNSKSKQMDDNSTIIQERNPLLRNDTFPSDNYNSRGVDIAKQQQQQQPMAQDTQHYYNKDNNHYEQQQQQHSSTTTVSQQPLPTNPSSLPTNNIYKSPLPPINYVGPIPPSPSTPLITERKPSGFLKNPTILSSSTQSPTTLPKTKDAAATTTTDDDCIRVEMSMKSLTDASLGFWVTPSYPESLSMSLADLFHIRAHLKDVGKETPTNDADDGSSNDATSSLVTTIESPADYKTRVLLHRWPAGRIEQREREKNGAIGISAAALQEIQLLYQLHQPMKMVDGHPNIMLPLAIISKTEKEEEEEKTDNDSQLPYDLPPGRYIMYQPSIMTLQTLLSHCKKPSSSTTTPTPPLRRLAPILILSLFHDLLTALDHCHRHHIVLRTLNPDQMHIDSSGTLKLSGLARAVVIPLEERRSDRRIDPLSSLSKEMGRHFSPYSPPELLLGGTRYTTQTDVWSLACLVCHLLLNKSLFSGKDRYMHVMSIFKVVGTPSKENYEDMRHFPSYERARPKLKYKRDVMKALTFLYRRVDQYGGGGKNSSSGGESHGGDKRGREEMEEGEEIEVEGEQQPSSSSLQSTPSSDGDMMIDGIMRVLEKMLHLDPFERITARQALQSPVFVGLDKRGGEFCRAWNALRETLKEDGGGIEAMVATTGEGDAVKEDMVIEKDVKNESERRRKKNKRLKTHHHRER